MKKVIMLLAALAALAGCSNPITPTVPTTPAIPETPTGLTVGSATVNSLTISWNASDEATSYQLYRNGSQVYSGSNTTYIDTGLTSSTSYSYTIQARNSSGTSASSAAVSGTTASNPPATSWTVKYTVTGTAATVDVTYENSSQGTSQDSGVTLPWSYSFTGHAGDFVYISAQNDGASGNVTATIYKNDTVFKQSTSSGAYVIAEADGEL